MFDLEVEELITLTEAAKFFPRRRGKKVSVSTLYRWSKYGCGGVILPTVQAGGVRATTVEGIKQFISALTYGNDEGSIRRNFKRRDAAIEAAERELEEQGI